jgi:hypothetical protein
MKKIIFIFITCIFYLMNYSSAQTTCSCTHNFGTSSGSTTYWSGTGLSGGGTVTSQTICVDGRLYIDVDARFNLCNFFMKPGSSIWVIDGSLFKASGTHFYRCGTSMWEGITADDGIIDFNHNWIYDAITGIDNTNGQPMIQFIQNTFDRCHTGLYASGIIPPRPFNGNKFICNGTLLSPYPSGQITDIGMVLINSTITERSCTYDNVEVGILSLLSSAITCYNDKFTNVRSAYNLKVFDWLC